ncbi:unnamed protein product [Phaeothamnion confervicola]
MNTTLIQPALPVNQRPVSKCVVNLRSPFLTPSTSDEILPLLCLLPCLGRSYKDYFNGYPRWYVQLNLVNTPLWNANPYINRVLFEQLSGGAWVPMYSFLEDYGYGVDPNYNGQTVQGAITDPSMSITARVRFVGDNGCPDGSLTPITVTHYGFISSAAQYDAVAGGAAMGATPAYIHTYSQPVSQCTAPGPWSGLRDAPPSAWLQSIKATKLCDCRWRIDVNYNPSYGLMVNNPFLDYISVKVAEGSFQRILILLHQPGKLSYSIVTSKYNCAMNYIHVNGIVYFDEFDGAVGYITRTNSCFAVPAVISNVCLANGVAYGGGGLATACNGLGSQSASSAYSGGGGCAGGAPTPTPPSPTPKAPTRKPTPKPGGGGGGSAYEGCWTDRVGARALPHGVQAVTNSATPLATCIYRCRAGGYAYAGLEYYGECWCGLHYDRYGRAAGACTTPCSGNPKVRCGGANALSVYKT